MAIFPTKGPANKQHGGGLAPTSYITVLYMHRILNSICMEIDAAKWIPILYIIQSLELTVYSLFKD